jgi:hypothetical protein
MEGLPIEIFDNRRYLKVECSATQKKLLTLERNALADDIIGATERLKVWWAQDAGGLQRPPFVCTIESSMVEEPSEGNSDWGCHGA